jgi:hypothetical protein
MTEDKIIEPDVISEPEIISTSAGRKVKRSIPDDFDIPYGKQRVPAILSPLSALLVLFLDYSFFLVEVPVILILLLVPIVFLIAFAGVFFIQRNLSGDSLRHSFSKAFICAAVTAVPTPVCGTVFGALVLALAGLNRIRR